MDSFEKDKLTQLHANTMNVNALVQQLKTVVNDTQINIEKIHRLEIQIATMNTELQNIKQIVLVMRAMSMGNGSTAH